MNKRIQNLSHEMLVSLTVGKVDAGVAVLLTDDKRLIEFPSILLPSDISPGSIVDVNVSRNLAAEAAAQKAFSTLQSQILSTFGEESPQSPVLRCRNATQTSIVLEWDPIVLASAELRSLSLHRNGTKAGTIPRPRDMTSTKISGLAVDTEYSFQLVLRTSAGTFSSDRLVVRTHKMTDLSGITVTPGIMASQLRDSLQDTIQRIGAKLVEQVRIDTTHFVCTEEGGAGWERARETNVPIVTPDWVKGCEREGRLVGVRGYYLNADPRLRQVGPGVIGVQRQDSGQSVSPQRNRAEGMAQSPAQQREIPRTHVTPPTPEVPQKPFPDQERTPTLDAVAESAPAPPAKDEPKSSISGTQSEPEAHREAREPTAAPEAVSASTPESQSEPLPIRGGFSELPQEEQGQVEVARKSREGHQTLADQAEYPQTSSAAAEVSRESIEEPSRGEGSEDAVTTKEKKSTGEGEGFDEVTL